ncbi:MAG: PFL family protein, partial [Coriobacteriia bacterium]|nr:PFL family protein [Coriobacteriia bacterium]
GAERLVPVCEAIQSEYGVPIVNKRIAVTPVAQIAAACEADDLTPLATALDEAARDVGVDFIGGFSALVHKGTGEGDRRLIDSIPAALSQTERVCSSVNVASTRSGINMNAVLRMAEVIRQTAVATADSDGFGCGKLVVFCNMVEDNPFMAGAAHGAGEADAVVNVGISGPGVVRAVVSSLAEDADLTEVAEAIKSTAFKITRVGELIAQEAARRLGVSMGIVDLSLAPTPAQGDSVADIIEAIGVKRCGGPGTTTALAMLNDAVKKGGAMGTSSIGGLSGAFIPVSEDAGMVRAVQDGALTLEKLEAMTAVCSVGLDMIPIPGDTSVETIAAIISDACAIGVINNKTTAARLMPVPGKSVGDMVEYGGLFGSAPVMSVSEWAGTKLVRRGGRVPAPLSSLRN